METVVGQGHANGDARRHLQTMTTADLLQRLQAVETSMSVMLSRMQELDRETATIEQNSKAAEAERKELGKVLIGRLGLTDLIGQRVSQVLEPKKRTYRKNSRKFGKSVNNQRIAEYLREQPGHEANYKDVQEALCAKYGMTRMAVVAALAYSKLMKVTRAGGRRGMWRLA